MESKYSVRLAPLSVAMSNAPAEVIALAEARVEAKANKDFALADHLREQISLLGWTIKDLAGSYELSQRPSYQVWNSMADAPEVNVSSTYLAIIKVDGWLADIQESVNSVLSLSTAIEIVLVDVSGDAEVGAGVHALASTPRVHEIHLLSDPGWGVVMRAASQKFVTEFVIFMDPSTSLTADPIPQLDDAFADSTVVSAGWRGALVNIEDAWRTVDDKGPGEVDVLLGYFMAVRRKALLATDAPHSKAIFYRNADLELSLELRAHGGRLIALDLPLEQGRHRGYHDSEPTMRERESKKNYDRILAKFRGRSEILSPRR